MSRFLILLTICIASCDFAYSANDTAEVSTTKAPKKSRTKITYRDYNFEGNCTEQNLDECGKVVFLFGNRGVHLPVNEKQMKPHCREEKVS